jgi:hypothetical protein
MFFLPLGGAATKVGKAPETANKARQLAQNFFNKVGVTFRNAPATSTAVEAGLGATSGAGGYIAEEMYPDSDSARFVGEIIGGVAPTTAAAAAQSVSRLSPVMYSIKKLREARNLLTPATTVRRGQDRFARAVTSLDEAQEALGEEFLEGLTPAARTGQPGLLALERAVDNELDDADKFLQTSIDTVNTNLRNAIDEFGSNPDATVETYLKAQDELRKYLDNNIQLAALRTERALADMAPTSSREAVNRVASNELRKALESARGQERALYDLIDQDAIVPTNNARDAFRKLLGETASAEIEDIPGPARTFLGNGEKAFPEQTTILEMRGLQSKLRQIARNARSGDNANLNRARMADIVADAITEDIANTQAGEEVAGLVENAVAFSRELNSKFRKGTVGTLLGFAKQGEPRVPSGLVLEQSIGLSGPRAREAFDDIVAATNTPEVNAAMEDFIKNKFFDYAVEEGAVNPSRANGFLRTNKEVLNRFPQVQDDIQRTIESLNVEDLRRAQRGRVSFDRPAVSRATMFIENGPERAFKSVLDSRNPPVEMANLVNMARRDTTGEALEGLKAAFGDYVQKNVMSGDYISGSKLDNFLSEPKTRAAMNRLFTKPEMRRWRVIQRTAERLDMQRAATTAREGILGDSPGKTTTVLARLLGARAGTNIAERTGIGGIQAQAIMSERFKDLLAQGLDPAKDLVMRAVQDEDLFKNLLMAEVSPTGEIPESARRRLNAWLLTIGNDDGEQ